MEPRERMSGALAGSAEVGPDGRFKVIYEENHVQLLRYAQGWTRDPETAEDTCQEAFARLYRAMAIGNEPGIPGAWLRRVVRNLAISRARHAEVEQRHAASLHEPEGHDPTARAAIEREHLAAVRSALARVPEAQRHLLVLAASGYSRAQLSESLGASPGAIRTRRRRRFTRRGRSFSDCSRRPRAASGGISSSAATSTSSPSSRSPLRSSPTT